MNSLDSLKKHTTVVADTGDFVSIKEFSPQDSTTNPSLIYLASKDPQYGHLIDDSVKYGIFCFLLFLGKSFKDKPLEYQLSKALDKVSVNFGVEILKIIPGRVSTEIDARFSFDKEMTIKKAKDIISLYKESNIDKSRVLLKIAATWEGIQAAKELEKEGIHCNLTLIFSLIQAIACAEANVFLISPFVGRILDWHKKNNIKFVEDPGVTSVKNIFNYYKKFGYKTIIMGASFRNVEEVINLCGLDYLTISPKFLKELKSKKGELEVKLSEENAKKMDIKQINLDEKKFRWLLNESACGTEKLSEGIRRFTQDIIKLEKILIDKLKGI